MEISNDVCMNNELERIKSMSIECNSIMILTSKVKFDKENLERQLSSLIRVIIINRYYYILKSVLLF